MLTLSRPHRQVLGTLVLVAGAIVPTVCVSVAAWRINRPGYRHEVEATLGQQLGLKVTLDGVRYPRPGDVVYSGIVLWQQEPRQKSKLVEVARAEEVRLQRLGRQIVLNARGLKLRGDGPRQAMTQVGEILRRGVDLPWDRISLTSETCSIDLAGAEGTENAEPLLRYSLRDVAATFRAVEGAPTLEASYRVVTPSGEPNRCELTLVRDRRGKEVETNLTFRTVEGPPLPARVLAPFFDPGDWLGPKATVAGSLTLSQTGSADWNAQFSGVLDHVDLRAALADRMPDHRLSGTARLTVDSSRWGLRSGGQGPGWAEAEGRLTSGPGAISTSLVQAMASEMRFRIDPKVKPTGDDLAFQNLGIEFRMMPDGELQLAGALGDAFEPNAVLVESDGYGSIAFAPIDATNLIGLRRSLGPPNADQAILVPATPELQFLDYLPIPSASRRGNVVGN